MAEETKVITEKVFDFSFSPLQQWEVAFIYAFACTFNPQHKLATNYYKLPDFTPEDLELEVQKQDSELIRNIICASLGNTLNRKNPIESFKIALCQIVTDKMKAFEIDLDVNPLTKTEFNFLEIDVKLYFLRSLIEWQLQDSVAVKSILDYHNNITSRNQLNPIRSSPIGIDSKKRNYWQFGDSCWIWREKVHTRPTFEWETVCKNIQDLDKLIGELSSTNRAEKALIKVISEEIYEIAEKEERRKIRKEKAESRRLNPIEITYSPIKLRSRSTRSKRVRYNYDEVYAEEEEKEDTQLDDDDDDFEEEVETTPEVRRSSRKVASPPVERPTRWSSRLNQSLVDQVDENLDGIESMLINSQKINIEQDMDTIPMETVNDSVSMENVNNSVSMETVNGSVSMENVNGSVPMETVNDTVPMDTTFME